MTKESILIMCILIYVATKYLFTLSSVAFPFFACMIKSNVTLQDLHIDTLHEY